MADRTPDADISARTADPDRWLDADGAPIDEDHRGLVYDIRTLVDRRRALRAAPPPRFSCLGLSIFWKS